MEERSLNTEWGEDRCPGVSWADLVAEDSRPIPDFLAADGYRYSGSEPIAADRYTSPDFFAREMAELWPKVWQFAARDEEFPDPGDLVFYENQDMENLPYVQDGLKASKSGWVELANYQEIRIRQFHQTLDKYLAAGGCDAGPA